MSATVLVYTNTRAPDGLPWLAEETAKAARPPRQPPRKKAPDHA